MMLGGGNGNFRWRNKLVGHGGWQKRVEKEEEEGQEQERECIYINYINVTYIITGRYVL